MVKIINKGTFEKEVIEERKTSLIDFYADWCGPCKMLSPVIEELSDKYGKEVAFFKVNVDKEPQLAAAYGVASIPTLLFFKDGKQIKGSVGLVSEDKIINMITE